MKQFGKYLLERQLAIGGMAEVFLARQHGPAGFEKTLVIKRILPHFANDEQFITMFLDEARTSAKLNHPNLVQIYELGEAEGTYYIAMEYIRGESLNKVIKTLKQHGMHMPLHLAAKIIASVCAGLDYAHNFASDSGEPLGLVHRDISPDNVLVSYAGAVKMIDFGIAKARTSESKTQAGAVKGKFCYMSPEQVNGRTLDRRSDIFSLGIVLHELTTLVKPFGDGADLMTVSAIVNDPPRSADELVEGYPEPLWDIISQALNKDRAKRFATAHEMQIALERFIHSRGEFLSDRDIGAYLRRLFSGKTEDVDELRLMASGIKSRIIVPPTTAMSAPSEAAFQATQVSDGLGEPMQAPDADAATVANPAAANPAAANPALAATGPTKQDGSALNAQKTVIPEPKPASAPAPAARPASGGGSALNWVIGLLVLGAVGAGGWFAWQQWGPQAASEGEAPTPVAVEEDAGVAAEAPDAGVAALEDKDAGVAAPDAGPPDAGAPDVGEPDAGAAVVDAGVDTGVDTGADTGEDAPDVPDVPDAGDDVPDVAEVAAAVEDVPDAAGVALVEDAGAPDAGAPEAPDAGVEPATPDAGTAADVGTAAEAPDAGTTATLAPGHIRVSAAERMVVRLDGKPVGRTDLVVEAQPGPHTVEVVGSYQRAYRVVVASGSTVPVRAEPPVAAATGTITFNIPAGLAVKLDGRAIGTSPIAPRKVPLGTHSIEMVNPQNPSQRGLKKVTLTPARPNVNVQ